MNSELKRANSLQSVKTQKNHITAFNVLLHGFLVYVIISVQYLIILMEYFTRSMQYLFRICSAWYPNGHERILTAMRHSKQRKRVDQGSKINQTLILFTIFDYILMKIDCFSVGSNQKSLKSWKIINFWSIFWLFWNPDVDTAIFW